MKKRLNKLLSVIVSVAMIFTMSLTAFAAEGDTGQPKELTVTNNYGMFKVSTAHITSNANGSYTLNIFMNSTSYDKAFAGPARAAANASQVIEAEQDMTAKTSKYVINLDSSQVNKEITVAFHSKKNAMWYNRTLCVNLQDDTLLTDTSSIAPVADDAANIPFDVSGADSSLGMFKITGVQSVVNGDGTVDITLVAGNSSRAFTKIAFISQDATEAEKEEAAIVGTPVKDSVNNEYMFTFSINVEDIGKTKNISHYQVKDGVGEWHNWSNQATLTLKSTPSLVDQLIQAIYIQVRNEYTDKLCKAAKDCWDALSEEQKSDVAEGEYFSRDTGDASKDNPRNQDGISEKELLVVSFGTSFNDSRTTDIGGIEKALEIAYPEYSVRIAFTAQIIINHIQSRDNEIIDNMEQALERAVANGVKELLVQPTHLMHGFEYEEMCEMLDKYKDKFDTINIAEPLLNSVSDKYMVAESVIKEAAKDAGFASVEDAKNSKDTAFIFMGHGTTHEADVAYEEIQKTFKDMNFDNVFIGTVDAAEKEEFDPKAVKIVKEAVKEAGYTKVVLRPLMVVAGDHANNDMADLSDEESWASIFKADGLEVECQLAGLGAIAQIQELYVQHVACALGNHDIRMGNLKPATMEDDGEDSAVCFNCDERIVKQIAKIADVKLSISSYVYDGKVKSPTVTVSDANGKELTENIDYTVKVPSGRLDAGTYTYAVEFKGNYAGKKNLVLTVNKAKYTPKATGYTGTYNGSKHTITLSGVKSGSTIKYRTSPTGTWTTTKPTRTNVGKTTVYYQITNKNYKTVTGSKTIVINPGKTYITSLSKGTKSFTVKWAKKTTQTTGYQIQYSTSSTFASGNKTVTVTSNKTTSKTIKSLKANKKYYVRVRTYKTVSGNKYYSTWSARKSVTTK